MKFSRVGLQCGPDAAPHRARLPPSRFSTNTSAVSRITFRLPFPKRMFEKCHRSAPFCDPFPVFHVRKMILGSEMNASARVIHPPLPPSRRRAYLRDFGRPIGEMVVIVAPFDSIGICKMVRGRCHGQTHRAALSDCGPSTPSTAYRNIPSFPEGAAESAPRCRPHSHTCQRRWIAAAAGKFGECAGDGK